MPARRPPPSTYARRFRMSSALLGGIRRRRWPPPVAAASPAAQITTNRSRATGPRWQPAESGPGRRRADRRPRRRRLPPPTASSSCSVTGGPLEAGLPPGDASPSAAAGPATATSPCSRATACCTRCAAWARVRDHVGQADSVRHLLLRRESLELALYSFRYLRDVNHVVALPPAARRAQDREQALLFAQGRHERGLDRPLSATLPAPRPDGSTRCPARPRRAADQAADRPHALHASAPAEPGRQRVPRAEQAPESERPARRAARAKAQAGPLAPLPTAGAPGARAPRLVAAGCFACRGSGASTATRCGTSSCCACRSPRPHDDLICHELCHVWQMQHHPVAMPLSYLCAATRTTPTRSRPGARWRSRATRRQKAEGRRQSLLLVARARCDRDARVARVGAIRPGSLAERERRPRVLGTSRWWRQVSQSPAGGLDGAMGMAELGERLVVLGHAPLDRVVVGPVVDQRPHGVGRPARRCWAPRGGGARPPARARGARSSPPRCPRPAAGTDTREVVLPGALDHREAVA